MHFPSATHGLYSAKAPHHQHHQHRCPMTTAATNPGQINTKSSRTNPNYKRGNGQRPPPAEKLTMPKNPVSSGIVKVSSRRKRIRQFPADEFDFGVSAAQGPRETMEDEAVVFETGKCGYMYAMVLDGHDGPLSVQWLADRLFDIFSEVTDNGMYNGDCDLEVADPATGLCCPVNLTPTLTEMFHEADEELLHFLKGEIGLLIVLHSGTAESGGIKAARSGSTATVALIKRDRLVAANVGDSRLVLCRNGRYFDVTTEHRLYGKGPTIKSEIERVKSAGGWVEDGRVCGLLAVSRAFGDWELKREGLQFFLDESVELGYVTKEFAKNITFAGDPVVATPDVTELVLQDSDEFLIMASDGIWDVISSADAVRLVKRQFMIGRSSQEIADYLCEIALKRHTTDNTACVVVDLLGAEARSTKRR